MKIVPLHLRQANEIVDRLHRHHKAIRVAKFSVGLEHEGVLIGAVICMRPACRHLDDGKTLEVCRLVTDGTPNACSMLYGSAARIAREMGYEKIQTYILDSEPGTSMKASGWVLEKSGCGGSPRGSRRGVKNPRPDLITEITYQTKSRWAKRL